MRANLAISALLVAGAFTAAAAMPSMADAVEPRSRLGAPMLAESRTPVLLAQRAIERRWGPAEDSVYAVVDLPAWRDETTSMAMSAAVPGAGQLYAGERIAGLAFVMAEVLGWASHLLWRERGHSLRRDAEALAGRPDVSASAWSFDRWVNTTQADPSELVALYGVDPRTFYAVIGSDPRYASGWSGDPERRAYTALRGHSEARLRNARYAAIGLWLNHAVSAAHALRAARVNNRPLERELRLRLKSGWNDGPAMFAMVERRF